MTSDLARRLAEEHALQTPPSERGAVESTFLAGWEARGEITEEITEEMVEAGQRGPQEAMSDIEVEARRLYTEGLWEKLSPTGKANYRLAAASRLSAALGGEGR